MRNVIVDLEFIYDAVRRGGPYALAGGVLVVILGLFFDILSMTIVGAIVSFVGFVDIVIIRFFGNGRPRP